MCLSRVFEKKGGKENLLLNNIQRIRFEGETIIFTDLLENETKIVGRLVLADLVGGKVVVETND